MIIHDPIDKYFDEINDLRITSSGLLRASSCKVSKKGVNDQRILVGLSVHPIGEDNIKDVRRLIDKFEFDKKHASFFEDIIRDYVHDKKILSFKTDLGDVKVENYSLGAVGLGVDLEAQESKIYVGIPIKEKAAGGVNCVYRSMEIDKEGNSLHKLYLEYQGKDISDSLKLICSENVCELWTKLLLPLAGKRSNLRYYSKEDNFDSIKKLSGIDISLDRKIKYLHSTLYKMCESLIDDKESLNKFDEFLTKNSEKDCIWIGISNKNDDLAFCIYYFDPKHYKYRRIRV